MKNTLLITLSILIIIAFSCQKEQITVENETEFNPSKIENGLILLGKKRENPYAIKNMEIALSNLIANNIFKKGLSKELVLKPTHYYVRFLPSTQNEFDILFNDSTIELFDYPLDYEIIEEGCYYHDPDLPEGSPTWLYTAVPIDYNFPEIRTEILEECLIPEEMTTELKSFLDPGFADLLEIEALRITGYLSNKKGVDQIEAREIPKGTFTVYDTHSGNCKGIRRVKIRVNNVIKWDTDYTDEDGNYEMNKKFSGDIHYA